MATTTAWRPNRAAQRATRVGSATAAVLSETLSAPARRTSRISLDAAHAAADRERDEGPSRGPLDDVEERAASLRRGGDVEEDELVGALGRVALGELGRIALVDEVDEAGALDDPAVGHVEAGDDATAQHQAARTSATKLTSRRRPSTPLRSGWNWTPSSGPRATAETNRRPCSVCARTSPASRVRRRARVRVDEVEVRAVARSRRTARARGSARPGSSRCAGGSVRPRGGPSGPTGPRASRRRPRRCASKSSCRPRQMPRNGRSPRARPGSARRGRDASRRAIAGAAAPTPGTTSASAPRMASRVTDQRARRPRPW